jgi:hypothetical protein
LVAVDIEHAHEPFPSNGSAEVPLRPRQSEEERTCFQEAGPFALSLHTHAGVAIVYGLNPTFETRLAAWRDAGYRVHAMTGVSWGLYQDYVRGEWDGVPHYEDAQTAPGGFRLEHGIPHGKDCFYMMPSRTYAAYLKEKLTRVIDAGALAIHLEEPEFWVSAGYSEGFKREWREWYGEEWQDPGSSPDARYRAEKLKQHLYSRTIEFLCRELKKHAAEQRIREFSCYVPTHSLLNYAHWGIVSPESRLVALHECDGLVGQVWTGTARTPTVYRGIRKDRTLEAAYCEYGALAGMVTGTGKMLWQLADPVEDDPNYGWDDYRTNWECTVVASLLVEESERFEVTPWPSRVFQGTRPAENVEGKSIGALFSRYLVRLANDGKGDEAETARRAFDAWLDVYHRTKGTPDRGDSSLVGLSKATEGLCFGDLRGVIEEFHRDLAGWDDQDEAQRFRAAVGAFYHNPTDERTPIPETYSTELQVVFNALADMAWPEATEWKRGQTGVGLAVSDTLMFQRGEPFPSDPDLSSVYGLAFPLVMNGTALRIVQLERAHEPDYLDTIRVLLLTYEGQKPPTEEIHAALTAWVERGGILVLFGTGDAYNGVREWWNQDELNYAGPQEHLCELLGLGRSPQAGCYLHGAGEIVLDSASPACLAHDPTGAEKVLGLVREAHRRRGVEWYEGNALVLCRGPYVIAARMDESQHEDLLILRGAYVNLFDAELGVLVNPRIEAGARYLLYDLERCPAHPWVIAAAGRVSDEQHDDESLRFVVQGAANTRCAVRLRLPAEPVGVSLDDREARVGDIAVWDSISETALLRFPNHPDGAQVVLRW